jgi:hypothetical protein
MPRVTQTVVNVPAVFAAANLKVGFSLALKLVFALTDVLDAATVPRLHDHLEDESGSKLTLSGHG